MERICEGAQTKQATVTESVEEYRAVFALATQNLGRIVQVSQVPSSPPRLLADACHRASRSTSEARRRATRAVHRPEAPLQQVQAAAEVALLAAHPVAEAAQVHLAATRHVHRARRAKTSLTSSTTTSALVSASAVCSPLD